MSNNQNSPNKLTVTDSVQEPSPNTEKKTKESLRKNSRMSNSRASNTPNKAVNHRRIASLNGQSISFDYSSPCKSRLDYTSVPDISVDLKACQNDIETIKAQSKRQILAEQRLMKSEWNKVKKDMKKKNDKASFEHEEFLTAHRLELKKMVNEQEKLRKTSEKNEKISDFFEVRDAKRMLKEQEKLKDLEYLRVEREKAIARQKQVDEKKERIRVEREEKRKAFLESIEAAKQQQVEEKLRVKRELEFEYAQELAGRRKMMMDSFESHKTALMKIEMILND